MLLGPARMPYNAGSNRTQARPQAALAPSQSPHNAPGPNWTSVAAQPGSVGDAL